MRNLFMLILGLGLVVPASAGVPEDIALLRSPSPDPTRNRAAWDRLVATGPQALIPILRQWPNDNPVAANWLRTAFDEIAQRHGGKLPVAELMQYLDDPNSPGKARRAVLAVMERVRPGLTASRLSGWLNDPEFGPDAVAERLAAADSAVDPEQATAILRSTFAATTDVEQALLIAKRLQNSGDKPDVTNHLGVITRWHLVGPFPVTPEEGLKQVFAPETKVDLTANYRGKAGTLKWYPAEGDPFDGRVDLAKHGIKPDDGSVAFATARVRFSSARKVEVRASAVDNITVWVNGKSVITRASDYRSMYRSDRYRASIDLPAGELMFLVKLTKTRAEEVRGKPGAPPKWDFQIRLVDDRGRGLAIDQPEEKK